MVTISTIELLEQQVYNATRARIHSAENAAVGQPGDERIVASNEMRDIANELEETGCPEGAEDLVGVANEFGLEAVLAELRRA